MRNIPQCENYVEFVRDLRGTILFVMHPQADLDAVGSTIAMTHLITQLNQNLIIRIFEQDLSHLGQILVKESSYEFNQANLDEIKPPVTLIFIDTNQIDPTFISQNYQYIIFDHHIPTKLEIPLLFDFRLPHFRATAEIISCIYYQSQIALTPEVVKCLTAGILFDTRRFLYADLELFKCMTFLLSNNPNIYNEANTLFSTSRSYSERNACIKAAQRMRKHQIGNYILLISNVSSYEAAAARTLITIGGDVSVVIAKRKNETRISLRAKSKFISETGISLGEDIVPALIKQFGGRGGGHDAAAGYNTDSLDINLVKNYLYDYFLKKTVKL